MLTIEQAIEQAERAYKESRNGLQYALKRGETRFAERCKKEAEENRQLSAWLRELQETRKDRDYWQEKANSYEQTIFKLTDSISKQPEIIFCHECKHWKDSDGVYRRGISAESKCPVNSRQVYEGTFFCGMAERRTDGEKQSD